MSDPPTPIIPPELLLLLARLRWRLVTMDPSGLALGVLSDGQRDRHFVPTAGGWAVLDELKPGLGPVLLCAETFAVLHGGKRAPDGSISHLGRNFQIQQWYTGTHWSARAVPAVPAASAA